MSKKFATLSDVKKDGGGGAGKGSDSDDSGSESGKNNRQAFYVGGGEKSGQQVLGPAKPNPNEIINNLFRHAREHGAQENVDQPSQQSGGAQAFGGAGFRLGDSIPTGSSTGNPQQAREPRVIRVVITLWRNGFVVDDGPLRSFEEPENKAFLDQIMNNKIPRELVMKHRDAMIDVELVGHPTDDYQPPRVAAQPFQGRGYTLGSPTPTVTGAGSVGVKVDTHGQAPTSSAAATASGPIAVDGLDRSHPVTSIQIRMADGSRLVGEFNHTHRISDVRNFIINAHPASASSNFVLMTSFPRAELSDEGKTLHDANLIQAVIMQHIKNN